MRPRLKLGPRQAVASLLAETQDSDKSIGVTVLASDIGADSTPVPSLLTIAPPKSSLLQLRRAELLYRQSSDNSSWCVDDVVVGDEINEDAAWI